MTTVKGFAKCDVFTIPAIKYAQSRVLRAWRGVLGCVIIMIVPFLVARCVIPLFIPPDGR